MVLGYVMATATSQGHAPADAIAALADRFDPSVIDIPGGRARVRLEVTGGTGMRRDRRGTPPSAAAGLARAPSRTLS